MSFYLRRDKLTKAFAESKHPRYPKGSPKGGEFRSATSSASFIFMHEAKRAENALELLKVKIIYQKGLREIKYA